MLKNKHRSAFALIVISRLAAHAPHDRADDRACFGWAEIMFDRFATEALELAPFMDARAIGDCLADHIWRRIARGPPLEEWIARGAFNPARWPVED